MRNSINMIIKVHFMNNLSIKLYNITVIKLPLVNI